MAGKNKTYELMLKIGGKVDGSLKTACSTADKNLAALGKTAKTAGKIAAGAMVAAATAVATLGTAAVKSAAEYEAQLANVSTLLTGTEAEVAARTAEIGDQVLEISNRTGVATADLTDGMYQVVSAFGDSADAAAILETAAKSAAAGNATTTDSINLLSAVTKGYGDTSAEAVQQAADLAFATVRLGQTSFPELAAGMGKVIPLASTLGLEQEQLWGAMATLTGVTGSTAEVVTQMKATMQAFLSPSKNMQAALKNMGYESGQALLESKGLQGSLDALKDAVGGNELAFAGLFSSVEAQTAVLAMAGNQAENLTSKTAEMYEATGAANTAFERQTNNLKYDIQMIKNLGANFLTQLGTNILPYVREFAEAALPVVSEALEKIGGYMTGTIIPAAKTAAKWISEHRTLILALAAGIASATVAFKTMKTAATAIKAVKELKTVWEAASKGGATLANASKLLTVKFLAISAAIAVAVAIGVLIYKNWDKIKAKAVELGAKISEVWGNIKTGVSEAVANLVSAFQSNFPVKHLAQLAGLYVFLDPVDAVVEPVDDADVENLTRFMLRLLHLERLGVGARGRLFAQDVLARAQRVDGNARVHIVGRADGYGLDFRIGQHLVIIAYRRAAAVFFDGRLRALGENIAEILDLRVRVLEISGNVRGVRDGAAADDGNLHLKSLLYFSGLAPR